VRDVSQIRLVDVYREFVFRAELSEGAETTALEALVAQHTRDAHDSMSTNLGTLFGSKPAERRKHAA